MSGRRKIRPDTAAADDGIRARQSYDKRAHNAKEDNQSGRI